MLLPLLLLLGLLLSPLLLLLPLFGLMPALNPSRIAGRVSKADERARVARAEGVLES